MRNEILIFTPTYNEAGNIRALLEQILALGLAADVLVMDDNSPDGTAAIVEEIGCAHPQVTLRRREGKLGIGSAHVAALRHAKERGYRVLVTLDADFSHQPADIPRFLEKMETGSFDVVVGSRFLLDSGLRQWNLLRKSITRFGHFLTKTLLGMPYDTSGAFRVYRMDRVPAAAIEAIESRDYEFFFESLTLLHVIGCRIGEVPVELSARVYGHSKMQIRHMIRGLLRLLRLAHKLARSRRALRRLGDEHHGEPDAEAMRVAWDDYWADKGSKVDRSLYDGIASFYRNQLIKPTLNGCIRRSFAPGAELVHAGCGGGEVDSDVVHYARVTAVDISPNAIAKYRALHGDEARTEVMDIFALSRLGRHFDGIYNLGVMEHFEDPDIKRLLREFNAVLRPNGRIVLFWPPVYGLSVIALHGIHFVLNRILRRNVQLHPPEPTKVRSRSQIRSYLEASGLELESMSFGARDAFTYVVIVARKSSSGTPPPVDSSIAA